MTEGDVPSLRLNLRNRIICTCFNGSDQNGTDELVCKGQHAYIVECLVYTVRL